MSHHKYIATFLLIVVFASCQHFGTKEAVRINDEVVQHQKQLTAALESFVTTLETKNEATITTALDNLKTAAKTGADFIGELSSPDCNLSLIHI